MKYSNCLIEALIATIGKPYRLWVVKRQGCWNHYGWEDNTYYYWYGAKDASKITLLNSLIYEGCYYRKHKITKEKIIVNKS